MGKEKQKNGFPVVETLKITGTMTILFWVLFLSFSGGRNGQVEAIRRRDRKRCQFPGCKNRTKYKVEVHHVIPQGYSLRINGMRPDSPFNAVCLCEEHHIGFPKKDIKTGIYREKQKGLIWDPIHPDVYLIHLVFVGKFHLLPDHLKEKINTQFPGLVEYYEQVNKEKRGPEVLLENMDFSNMYTDVMRKWRSDRLDNRQIYWDSSHDYFLQIAAITNTLKAIKNGWRFPLRMLGGNVKPINRGSYAWDNLVSVSIQNYVTSLSVSDLNNIISELKKAKSESRIVYYNMIYVPSVAHFENKTNMDGMINHYLASLTEEKRSELIKRFDRSRNGRNGYKILYSEFYQPALFLHKSNGGVTLPEYSRRGGIIAKKH